MKIIPAVICLFFTASSGLELNTSLEPNLQFLQRGHQVVQRARLRRQIRRNNQEINRIVQANSKVQIIGGAKTTHHYAQSGMTLKGPNRLSNEEQAMRRVEEEGRALLRRCGRLPPPPPEDMEFEREVAKLRGLLQGCAAHEVNARRWNRVLSPKLIRDYMHYLEWQDKKLARLQRDKPQIIIDSGAAACEEVANRGGSQTVQTEAGISVPPQQEQTQDAPAINEQRLRGSQIGGNIPTTSGNLNIGRSELRVRMAGGQRLAESASARAQVSGRTQATTSRGVVNMRSGGSKSTVSLVSGGSLPKSRSKLSLSANASGGGSGYKSSQSYMGVSGSRNLGLSGTASESKATRGSLNVSGGTTGYRSTGASSGNSRMTFSSGRVSNSVSSSGRISGSRSTNFSASTSSSRGMGASGGATGSGTSKYMSASRTSGSATSGSLQAKGSRASGGSMRASGSGGIAASGSMRVSGSGSMKVSGSGGTSGYMQTSGSASRTTGGSVSMQASGSKTVTSAGSASSSTSKSGSLSVSASGSTRR